MSDDTTRLKGLPNGHRDPLVSATIDRIRAHGWAVTAISDECDCGSAQCLPPDGPFGYTTGLVLHSLPELAVYGLDATTSALVLNELGDLLHGYEWRAIVAQSVEVSLRALDVPIRLIELLDKEDLVITNELFPDSPALQVVWPDDRGHFPWAAGYALSPDQQQIKGVLPAEANRPRGRRVVKVHTGPNRTQRRHTQRRKNRP